MATVSFGGLGNGIDFGQVVTELVKIQRLPIDKLNEKKTALQSKLTDLGSLGTKLLAVQGAADALRLASSFDRTSATVSDEEVLSLSSSSTAVQGNYRVQVTQLATAHQITNKAAKAVASSTADIVAGTSAVVSFRVGTGTEQTVTLGDSGTLEDLRTAINDLGAGVTASIVNSGTAQAPAYRLVLTGTSTGAANTISITADGTALDLANTSGTGGADTLQVAQDAILVIGDPAQTQLTIQRSGNTVTDVIPGVTLNLKQVTVGTDSVNVTISLDTATVKDNIKKLVAAYNDVVKFIHERATFDPATSKAGILTGESAVRTTLSTLRQAISGEVPGLSTYTSAGQVGFKTERDGTLTLDEARLSQALSTDYAAARALFIRQSTVTGIAQRITEAVDRLDELETGVVSSRKNSLTKEIEKMADSIQRKEDEVAAYEARLRLQYANLDGLLRQLQSQADFLRTRIS